jgi:hypothetical protein
MWFHDASRMVERRGVANSKCTVQDLQQTTSHSSRRLRAVLRCPALLEQGPLVGDRLWGPLVRGSHFSRYLVLDT